MVSNMLAKCWKDEIKKPEEVVNQFLYWYRQRSIMLPYWLSLLKDDLKGIYPDHIIKASHAVAVQNHMFKGIRFQA